MTIPLIPTFFDMIYTDKDGKMTADSYLYNDQMFQSLNVLLILINNLTTNIIKDSNIIINGFNVPSKTTSEILSLESKVPNGTIWYNSSIKKLQFKADSGIIQTISSS